MLLWINTDLYLVLVIVPHGMRVWIVQASVLLFNGNSLRLNLSTDKDVQLWTETEHDLFRHKTYITIQAAGVVNCYKQEEGKDDNTINTFNTLWPRESMT